MHVDDKFQRSPIVIQQPARGGYSTVPGSDNCISGNTCQKCGWCAGAAGHHMKKVQLQGWPLSVRLGDNFVVSLSWRFVLPEGWWDSGEFGDLLLKFGDCGVTLFLTFLLRRAFGNVRAKWRVEEVAANERPKPPDIRVSYEDIAKEWCVRVRSVLSFRVKLRAHNLKAWRCCTRANSLFLAIVLRYETSDMIGHWFIIHVIDYAIY